MTGEMTLRGLVLPVGGIKDKVCSSSDVLSSANQFFALISMNEYKL